MGFGDFEFFSDGFQNNYGVEHGIYDFSMHWDVTPERRVQVEGRHWRAKNGDLAFNFDPGTSDPYRPDGLTEASASNGPRYKFGPHNATLACQV